MRQVLSIHKTSTNLLTTPVSGLEPKSVCLGAPTTLSCPMEGGGLCSWWVGQRRPWTSTGAQLIRPSFFWAFTLFPSYPPAPPTLSADTVGRSMSGELAIIL